MVKKNTALKYAGATAVLSGFILISIAVLSRGVSLDALWSIKAGQYVLSHHDILKHDIYSYTVQNRPWVSQEWGFEVLLAWLYSVFGNFGLWLVAVLPSTITLVILNSFFKNNSTLTKVLLIWGGTIALINGADARPQVFSYLFFTITLYILIKKEGLSTYLLPPLFFLWANMHGSFLFGVAVVGAFFIIKRTKLMLYTAILVVLSTVVNPWGPYLWEYDIRLTFSSQLGNIIQEWQSPNFHNLTVFITLGVGSLFVAALFRKKDPMSYILVVATLLTFRAVRMYPYFGISFVVLLGSRYTEMVPKMLPLSSLQKKYTLKENIKLLPALVPTLALTCLTLFSFVAISRAIPSKNNIASLLKTDPGNMFLYAKTRGGRVFTTYDWASYSIWNNEKTYVDSRTDLYLGTSTLTNYIDIINLTRNPVPILARSNVRWIILPKNNPLVAVLRAHNATEVKLTTAGVILEMPEQK